MSRFFDDASNERLENSTALITQRPWSGCAWFKTNESPTTKSADLNILSCGDTGTSLNFVTCRVEENTGQDRLQLRTANTPASEQVNTLNSVLINQWQHAAWGEISQTSRWCVLNGDLINKGVNLNSIDFPESMDETAIGVEISGTGRNEHFSGDIAEVAIWDGYELTDAQVIALSRGLKPNQIDPPPTHYWPLRGRLDPEPDVMPSPANMTLTSANIDPSPHPPLIHRIARNLISTKRRTDFAAFIPPPDSAVRHDVPTTPTGIITRPWTTKPDISQARLNWNHSAIDKDLLGVFLPQADQRFKDILNGDVSVYAGTTTPTADPDHRMMGIGRKSDASSDSRENFANDRYAIPASSSFSIAAWFRIPLWINNGGVCGSFNNGGADSWRMYAPGTVDSIRLLVNPSGGLVVAFVTDSRTFNGQLVGAIGRYNGTTTEAKLTLRYYDDSAQLDGTSGTTSGTLPDMTAENFSIGSQAHNTGFSWDDGTIYQVIYSERAWSDLEVNQLLDHPLDIYKPRRTIISLASFAEIETPPVIIRRPRFPIV